MSHLETELSLRAHSCWGACSVDYCEMVSNGRTYTPWFWVLPTGAAAEVFFLHLRHSNTMATLAGTTTTPTKVTKITGSIMVVTMFSLKSVVGVGIQGTGSCITHACPHAHVHIHKHAHTPKSLLMCNSSLLFPYPALVLAATVITYSVCGDNLVRVKAMETFVVDRSSKSLSLAGIFTMSNVDTFADMSPTISAVLPPTLLAITW